MFARILGMLTAVAVLGGAGGCSRPEPAIPHVDARNFGAYSWWRSTVLGRYPADVTRDFDQAIQQVRFRVMEQGATGSEGVAAAMCAQVNGLTIEEVLRLGDRIKLERLESTRDQLKAIVDANGLLTAKPGNSELSQELGEKWRDQQDRLHAILLEIEATQKQLLAHGGTPRESKPMTDKPAVLPRQQALDEFAAIVQARRQFAMRAYGDWPASVEPEGRRLMGPDRADFRAKLRAAEYNQHAVIPVYLRARWRIFDEVVKYPEWGPAVTGNLTAEDKRRMQEEWANSEAENWARQNAASESDGTAAANMMAELKGMMEGKTVSADDDADTVDARPAVRPSKRPLASPPQKVELAPASDAAELPKLPKS